MCIRDRIKVARHNKILTGLPDAYGRGRIIGDYRRVALYGVDRLIEDKQHQKDTTRTIMYSDVTREREELSEQIKALKELKELGCIYGFDISRPAANVQEAIQWLYFGYLAAIKEQNGAATVSYTHLLCYALGYRFLGKAFLKNALFSSLAFAVCYRFWESVGYLAPDLSAHPLVSALVGGVFVGVGVGLVVREGGASGGDDALAMVLSRVLRCPIERAYFATDFTVLLLSLSYIPVKNILFSLITVTLSSFVIGRMQNLGRARVPCPERET